MRVSLAIAASASIIIAGCADPEATATNNVPNAPVVAPVPKAVAKREVLTCTLRGEPTCELGKSYPLTLALTNRSDADIQLVGSLDGSGSLRRYPHCYYEEIGPARAIRTTGFSGCGNMNPLREKDFVKVPSGGSFDPHQRIDGYGFFGLSEFSPHTLSAVGEYRIRFVYDTTNTDILEWAGDGRWSATMDPKLVALFEHVPKLKVVSNELKVTVVARGK